MAARPEEKVLPTEEENEPKSTRKNPREHRTFTRGNTSER
jgi:hypothetical protein